MSWESKVQDVKLNMMTKKNEGNTADYVKPYNHSMLHGIGANTVSTKTIVQALVN